MSVDLRTLGGALVLTVSDDGVGFDVESVSGKAHYGLRGLASLVHDNGGVLRIESTPGAGTTTRLEIDA
jgi:signal transduction histidine kinase